MMSCMITIDIGVISRLSGAINHRGNQRYEP
jgi:hypothetical protein